MTTRFQSFLLHEKKRWAVCVVATVLVSAPIIYLWLLRGNTLDDHAAIVGTIIVWTTFAIIQAGATFIAHRTLTSDQLSLVFQATTAAIPAEPEPAPSQGQQSGPASAKTGVPATIRGFTDRFSRAAKRGERHWRRSTDGGNQAPSWSVHVSFLALLVVGGILVTPALHGSRSVLVVALAMVAGSWTNVLVAYSVHYARMDTRTGGFSFPGEQTRVYIDYLYLAMSVQTTFGTTDVTVISTTARRAVMGHSTLAFIFNSVLIAMIISLLLAAAL